METRPFGRTGIEVGVLGFGGSEIGFGSATQAEIDSLLNEALDAGCNVIDTAECYVDSEEKIGRAIGHRRDTFHLFTKTGHASGFSEPDWDPAMMAKQIDRSLVRLKTDRLDLIQLHSPSLESLREGTIIEVLKRAKEAGKVRFIGCSADNEPAIFAAECGAFDALQTSVNIADQEAIERHLPLAAAAGLGVVAKRPIANAAWIKKQGPNVYGHTYWLRLQELDYPFLSLPAAEAVAIALRFTLRQPGVATAIVGTEKPGRFLANLRALQSVPEDEDLYASIVDRWKAAAPGDWVGQG